MKARALRLRASRGLVAALALAAGGCDFAAASKPESPVAVPPVPGAQAQIRVFVLPNPVIATQDSRRPSSRVARWTLQVLETGGVGGTLTFVNDTLRDAVTGAPVEPQGFLSLDGTAIRARAGTDRLGAGGTLAFAQSLAYEGASSGATLAIAVQVVDDNGNVVGGAITVRVQ